MWDFLVFEAIYINLAADILVMDSGDTSGAKGVPVWPIKSATLPADVTKTKASTTQLMPGTSPGRPSKQSLFLKEKATNKPIKQFFQSSPSIKRPAAINDNLENLTSPITKKISRDNPFHPPPAHNSETSPPAFESSLNETIIVPHTMSSPTHLAGEEMTIPPLDSANIDPQMRDFLQIMLRESRASTKLILDGQRENAMRLDALEHKVYENNLERMKDFEEVKLKMTAVDVNHNESRKIFEARLEKIENSGLSNTGDMKVRKLEEKLEAEDKANRQNNIVLKGFPVPLDDMREAIRKFLLVNFNYTGQIGQVKPLGRDPKNKNIVNLVAITLESLEAKLHILRNKKVLANMKSVFVRADLTDRERMCAAELGKFARRVQPGGKGVQFAYQKVFVKNKWFKWDVEKNSAVECEGGPKHGRTPPANSTTRNSPTVTSLSPKSPGQMQHSQLSTPSKNGE